MDSIVEDLRVVQCDIFNLKIRDFACGSSPARRGSQKDYAVPESPFSTGRALPSVVMVYCVTTESSFFASGHILAHRPVRNHNARCMGGGVARHPLQLDGPYRSAHASGGLCRTAACSSGEAFSALSSVIFSSMGTSFATPSTAGIGDGHRAAHVADGSRAPPWCQR